MHKKLIARLDAIVDKRAPTGRFNTFWHGPAGPKV